MGAMKKRPAWALAQFFVILFSGVVR